jgi:twinkle protein
MVIDPWNELDHSRKAQYTETEYISSALTKIRRFARLNNIHIWVIAHPTKMQRQASGNYAVPTPYDIAGSAHFRNKPDNCICIWRDLSDESKHVDIHIQKVRFRHLGKVGKVQLKFNIGSGRYE